MPSGAHGKCFTVQWCMGLRLIFLISFQQQWCIFIVFISFHFMNFFINFPISLMTSGGSFFIHLKSAVSTLQSFLFRDQTMFCKECKVISTLELKRFWLWCWVIFKFSYCVVITINIFLRYCRRLYQWTSFHWTSFCLWLENWIWLVLMPLGAL